MYLIVALGAVTVGALFLLDRVAATVVRPRPGEPERTVPSLGVPHEDLIMGSGDRRVRGWLLHPDPAARREILVLLTHGWGANYGTLLALAEPLVSAGYEVLLFDIRGHGRNDERANVTIRHFRDDVITVSEYAASRFPGRRKVVMGHSLGGAAAIIAAARGAPVDGIVTLASPANVMQVTAGYLKDRGMPGGFIVVAMRPFWWLRIGSTFRRLIPEREVRRVDQPLLIIQPEDDRRVPRAHAERLARASGSPCRIITGAHHTDVLENPETHHAVLEFLEGLEG